VSGSHLAAGSLKLCARGIVTRWEKAQRRLAGARVRLVLLAQENDRYKSQDNQKDQDKGTSNNRIRGL
jgi:hypothetical protein